MKILASGNKNTNVWIGECIDCNAIVQCDSDELSKQHYHFDYSWEQCPDCRKIKRTLCFHPIESKVGKEIYFKIQPSKK
jgi:hypothetical protein